MDFIKIDGPISLGPVSQTPQVFIAAPGDGKTASQAAAEILKRFASRAFRRPVTKEELAAYTALFERGNTDAANFKHSLRLPLTAILVSPNFLFKVEGNGDEEGEFPLNDVMSHRDFGYPHQGQPVGLMKAQQILRKRVLQNHSFLKRPPSLLLQKQTQ